MFATVCTKYTHFTLYYRQSGTCNLNQNCVVVERRTPNREVLGSMPTGVTCCVLEQDTFTPYSTG